MEATIDHLCHELRLDIALSKLFPDHSRAYFQSLIENARVRVNGGVAKKRHRVKKGDTIHLLHQPQAPLEALPQAIPLTIIYEDETIIVVDKPQDMVVHPAPGAPDGTLVNALLHHLGQFNTCDDPLRPGIVHRLDKDTSGLIVVAKDRISHHRLAAQFADRSVQKEYLAITISKPQLQSVNAPLDRHPVNRQQMAVCEGGRDAQTDFIIEKQIGDLFLVRAKPHTGRTHQIRVHARHAGAPILGDPTYGSALSNRKYHVDKQLLHSHKITLTHPQTGREMTFATPFPERFCKYF